MKVLSIKEKHRQADGKLYYRVELEDTPKPLITYDAPPFSTGYDIPQDSLILSDDGQTYSLKSDTRTDQQTERDSSIREQTAIKAIIDLVCTGKLKEFEESNDYLVSNARDWVNIALIHGPLMQTILGQGKIGPINEK